MSSVFFVCCCHIDLIAVVVKDGILLFLLKAEFYCKEISLVDVLKILVSLVQASEP